MAAMGDLVTVGTANRDQGHLVIVHASHTLKVRDGRGLTALRTPGKWGRRGDGHGRLSRRWSSVQSASLLLASQRGGPDAQTHPCPAAHYRRGACRSIKHGSSRGSHQRQLDGSRAPPPPPPPFPAVAFPANIPPAPPGAPPTGGRRAPAPAASAPTLVAFAA